MSITRLVWYIFLFVLQDGEDDVRQLTCYPHNRLLWFHSLFVLEILCTKSRIPADGNPRSLDDHGTELLVPPKGLLAMHGLLTAAVAGGYQAEIGGKLVLVVKAFYVTDLSQDAHRNNDADSWDCPKQVMPVFVSFCLTHLPQLSCCLQQRTSEDFHLPDEQVKRGTCI